MYCVINNNLQEYKRKIRNTILKIKNCHIFVTLSLSLNTFFSPSICVYNFFFIIFSKNDYSLVKHFENIIITQLINIGNYNLFI